MVKRRDFLKDSVALGTLAAIAGCATKGAKIVEGPAMMQGFADRPIPEVKIGIVGVGMRARDAINCLTNIPGCKIVAVCDLLPERVAAAQAIIVSAGHPKPVGFTDYEKMLDSEFDVVYVVTPWKLHAQMGVRAMEKGKHVMIEVPAAMTLEECWALVETSERTKRHCMQLENCCYGEAEMLCLNLVRQGLLGEIIYGEGAYIHDLHVKNYLAADKDAAAYPNGYTDYWRLRANTVHKGNQYETHGLVPLCQYMNINRGDRMKTLVSMETKQFTFEDFAKRTYPGTWKANIQVEMGDMNQSMIQTEKGRVILVQHDVSSPRPYSRRNLCQGSKGIFEGIELHKSVSHMYACGAPVRLGWRADAEEYVEAYFPFPEVRKIAEEHRHPLWKTAGEYAKTKGGHGGMDFIMNLRWVYCLQKGLPLDMDVYDLATVCSLGELTERSVRAGSAPMEVPDFTRGGWKTAKPLGIVDIEFN